MIARARRTVQGLTLLFLVIVPVLNKHEVTFISGSLYSLAVGPVWLTDPLIGIQTILTARTADAALLLSMLIPVFLAFALGRVFCSWVCPQNIISEVIDRTAARFHIRRRFAPRPGASPRYVVLGVLFLLLPLAGIPLASLLSAPGIISVQTAQVIYQGTIGLELALIGVIIVAELFLVRRAWCNYLCPVGSFLGLFRTRRTLRVSFEPDAERVCGKCLACSDACPLGLDPLGKGLYPQCHNCGACIDACEEMRTEKKPLVFRF
jgi:ferredoxin-type protein NapH